MRIIGFPPYPAPSIAPESVKGVQNIIPRLLGNNLYTYIYIWLNSSLPMSAIDSLTDCWMYPTEFKANALSRLLLVSRCLGIYTNPCRHDSHVLLGGL